MVNKKVSVILPVYNEEKILKKNIMELMGTLEKIFEDYEIIISEDGSTDKTREIAKSLECENVKVLHHNRRKGKGAAIRTAALHSKGDIVLFMDADLASNPEHVGSLVKLLEGGAAIVIGSRYLRNSKAKRAPLRYVASKSFNFLVRTLLGSKLSDHQCGFKAFRKDLIIPLMNEIEERKWFWDTELLVKAQRNGLKVVEMPIEWKEAGDSKFNLMRDTYHMACSLISFKLKK